MFVVDSSPIDYKEDGPFIVTVVIYSLLAFVTVLAIVLGCLGFKYPILNAFNAYQNYEKVIHRTNRKSSFDLTFMDGIRALSTLTVIFGHEFLLRLGSSTNLLHLTDF